MVVLLYVLWSLRGNKRFHSEKRHGFANIKGTPVEKDFFDNHSGPGKLYPGGSKCTYKEKEVPCMCRWTPRAALIQLSWMTSWGHLTTLIAMTKTGAMASSQCCYLTHMGLELNLNFSRILTLRELNGSFVSACHMVRLSGKLVTLLNRTDSTRWHVPSSRGDCWWWSGAGRWFRVFIHGRSCWSLMPRGNHRSFELSKTKKQLVSVIDIHTIAIC